MILQLFNLIYRVGSAIFLLVLTAYRLVNMCIICINIEHRHSFRILGFPSISKKHCGCCCASHLQMDRHASPEKLSAATVAKAPTSQNERRPQRRAVHGHQQAMDIIWELNVT